MSPLLLDVVNSSPIDVSAPTPTPAAKNEGKEESFRDFLQQAERSQAASTDAPKSQRPDANDTPADAATVNSASVDEPRDRAKSTDDANERRIDEASAEADQPNDRAGDDDGDGDSEVNATEAVAADVAVVAPSAIVDVVVAAESIVAEQENAATSPVDVELTNGRNRANVKTQDRLKGAAEVVTANHNVEATLETAPTDAAVEKQGKQASLKVQFDDSAANVKTKHEGKSRTEPTRNENAVAPKTTDAVAATPELATSESATPDASTDGKTPAIARPVENTTEPTSQAGAATPPVLVNGPPDVARQAVTATEIAATTDRRPQDPDNSEAPPHKLGASDGRSDGPASPIAPPSHRLSSETIAGRAVSNNDGPALSQADRTRLVQRVARAVQTAHDRGGELKLRLSPPELGSLTLQVQVHDGALSARIETETRDAQRVLTDHLIALRDRLSEQGIKVEKFDIDLSNSGGGGAAGFAERRFDDGGRDAPRGEAARPTGDRIRSEIRSEVTPKAATAGDGRLNVVV